MHEGDGFFGKNYWKKACFIFKMSKAAMVRLVSSDFWKAREKKFQISCYEMCHLLVASHLVAYCSRGSLADCLGRQIRNSNPRTDSSPFLVARKPLTKG